MWHEDSLPDSWRPSSCSGIVRKPGAVIVEIAGSVALATGIDDMLGRLAAVSKHRTVTYWSKSRQRERPILDDASALSGPNLESRRADFTPAELAKGGRFYILYDDSEPVGPVVHQLDIEIVEKERMTLQSQNLTSAKILFWPLVDPGALQSYVTMQRLSENRFAYYALSSSTLNWQLLPDESFVNRALAVFRYYTAASQP